jgi:hypothetical protein
LSEAEVISNLIRSELDLDINDVGFLVEGSRYEAAFNRFIHKEKSIYPVVSREYVQDRWEKFLRDEKVRIEECVFVFCLSNGLVAQHMEEGFWKPSFQHAKLPKDLEMVRTFSRCLRDTFISSEYPRELGKFFLWVEAMEHDVALNQFAKPKLAEPVDKKYLEVTVVETEKPILFVDGQGKPLDGEQVGKLTILLAPPQDNGREEEERKNSEFPEPNQEGIRESSAPSKPPRFMMSDQEEEVVARPPKPPNPTTLPSPSAKAKQTWLELEDLARALEETSNYADKEKTQLLRLAASLKDVASVIKPTEQSREKEKLQGHRGQGFNTLPREPG